MLDTTGHVITWNEGAARLKGYQASEIIGQHFSLFYPEEDLRDGKPEWELQVATAKGQCEDEGWRLRRDGSRFWASVIITALHDDKGQLRGFAKVTRDITERRNADTELRAARDAADAANRAKSEFLSRMSHELRTPLNAILGFGQLLAKQEFAPAQQERVQHILKAGRHLLALINEVLDIARIEAGQMTLSVEPVLIGEAVREVFSLLRLMAAEHDLRLQGEDTIPPDVFIMADRQRLKQVLMNLCANAIKYNRPHGMVTVSTETLSIAPTPGEAPPDAAPQQQLRISINDTGVGIPEAAQNQLFIPFMRMGAEQTTIEGTGLGLALSRSLTHAMGGTIGAQSTVGVGSTFWLQFPLALSSDLTANGAPEIAVHQEVPVPDLSSHYTLLYIEDNLSNLQLIKDILADQHAYHLLEAMQGQLGLDLARQHRPDLILLDLHLPDLPGDQVLAHLKADPTTASIPVIMLSAVAMESEIKRLLAAGASDYLTKPLDVDKFLETVAQFLKRTDS